MNSKFNKILKFQIIVFIILFILTLLTFICLGIITHKISKFNNKNAATKIINDISVYNNDKKHISEREFKQRFPKAYKTWRNDVKTLDDEQGKIDGALYIIQNSEIIIYFHNGYEPTFVLKYDNVSGNWYETSPE